LYAVVECPSPPSFSSPYWTWKNVTTIFTGPNDTPFSDGTTITNEILGDSGRLTIVGDGYPTSISVTDANSNDITNYLAACESGILTFNVDATNFIIQSYTTQSVSPSGNYVVFDGISNLAENGTYSNTTGCVEIVCTGQSGSSGTSGSSGSSGTSGSSGSSGTSGSSGSSGTSGADGDGALSATLTNQGGSGDKSLTISNPSDLENNYNYLRGELVAINDGSGGSDNRYQSSRIVVTWFDGGTNVRLTAVEDVRYPDNAVIYNISDIDPSFDGSGNLVLDIYQYSISGVNYKMKYIVQ
jgi:hypothetical protein